MRMRLALAATLALALALLAACGGDPAAPDARPAVDAQPIVEAMAAFDPPAPGDGGAWGVVPYPSDLYLDDDGKLRLTALPTGEVFEQGNVDMLLAGLATMDGAGLRSNAYFPIELAGGRDLDPATVTASSAVMIDLDASTAGDVIELPADTWWRPDIGAIVVVPALGTVLAPGHTYAAYVTDAIATTDGAALAPSPDFVAATADAAPAEPDLAAAHASLAPLLDVLPAGVRDRLVAATVFRTATFPAQTKRMRDVVAALPPSATVDAIYGPAEVGPDGLQVVTGDQTPGAIPGVCGSTGRPQPHDHIALIVHGTIGLTSFLSATPNVDGFPEYDVTGEPVVKGTHPVKFTLTLPVAADWDDVPVILYVHGINRTRHDMLTQANTAGRLGFAVLAIDLPYHGHRANRAAEQMDVKNETLGTGSAGAPTPDGFGDTNGLFPATQLFHLGSSGGIPGYHPRAMGENLRAAAVEQAQLVAWVRDGDLTALDAAIAPLTGVPDALTFSGDVMLLTESLGAMVSGVTLAIEPGIGAAFVSSPAAGFPQPSMMHSPNYAGLFQAAVTEPYGVADRVDILEPSRQARVEPIVVLFGNVVERGDAIAYAPMVTSGALRGGTPADVVVGMSWGDVWVSNDGTEAYTKAMGLPVATMAQPAPPGDDPVVGGLVRYVDLEPVSWPVSGNLAGGKSGCFVVFHPAGHAAMRKYEEVRNHEPVHPPFVPLDPERVIFPTGTAEMQQMWSELFADHVDGGGAASIQDPFRDATTWPAGSACPPP